MRLVWKVKSFDILVPVTDAEVETRELFQSDAAVSWIRLKKLKGTARRNGLKE